MRILNLIILFLLITKVVNCQQFDISGLYSSSTTKEFKNNWGYSLGYNHFIKCNRLGLSFSQYFYNTEYDDIRSSTEDGISKYIEEYDPKNRRIAINLIYSFKIIENEKSNLYLGCNAGLNYYKLQGEKIRIENGFISGGDFTYNNKIKNRLGFGLLIEYEINEVISDKISTSIKINPELTSYDEWGMVGGYAPWIIG